jgi:hypothetical protein
MATVKLIESQGAVLVAEVEAGEAVKTVEAARLKGAMLQLRDLHSHLAPEAALALSLWSAVREPLTPGQRLQAARAFAGMIARARSASEEVARSGAASAPAVVKLLAKVARPLAEFLRALDGITTLPPAKCVAWEALRAISSGERPLALARVTLWEEYKATREGRAPNLPRRKRGGRPRNEKLVEWYEEVRRLADALGSFKEAVATFGKSQGRKLNVETVRKWGLRARKRRTDEAA